MNFIKIILLSCFLSFFINFLNANSIKFENNERLSFNDINNLTQFDLYSSDLNKNDLNLIVKDLVSSDLISNIDVSVNDNYFIITIYESFFVNKIFINGNVKLNDDDILKNLSIKNKSFIDNNKITSNSLLIENMYNFIGQKNIIVKYYLEQFNDNSYNLIYDVTENIESYLSNIIIQGNYFLSTKFIKSSIPIKEKKFFTTLSISNYVDEYKINNSLSKISNIYKNNGYLNFTINYEIKTINNKIKLYLYINEGTRYVINDIKFISNNETIKKLFQNNDDKIINLFKNKFYDDYNINKITDDLNSYLLLNNYPNLSVDFSYSLSNDAVILNFFDINKAPETINNINFTGNSVTQDSTLRRQLFIKPGDIYNKRLVQKSLNNLIRRPYIDNVVINTNKIINNSLDLDFTILEKVKSGNFKIGAGYSAQGGAATSIGLSDANFYGTGNKVNGDITLSSKSTLFDISYNKFYLSNYNIDNKYRLFNKEEDLKTTYGYKRKSSGFDFTIKIPQNYDVSTDQYFSFSAGYEKSDIYDLTSLASSSTIQNSGISNNFFTSAGYINDTRNDDFNPTTGKIHITSVEIAPTGLSDDDFVKLSLINNYYFNNKNSDNSFFILSKLGIAAGLSNKIKTKDSFVLGGDFKGFQYSGIGPRDSSLNYLGGTKMYQLTLGYASPFLFDNSDVFILKYFGTVGSVFDSEFISVYDSKAPRVSLGASLDVMTPIGPLSFSLSSPISKSAQDKTQTYDFSIGSTF